jgi:hypothetical protein
MSIASDAAVVDATAAYYDDLDLLATVDAEDKVLQVAEKLSEEKHVELHGSGHFLGSPLYFVHDAMHCDDCIAADSDDAAIRAATSGHCDLVTVIAKRRIAALLAMASGLKTCAYCYTVIPSVLTLCGVCFEISTPGTLPFEIELDQHQRECIVLPS